MTKPVSEVVALGVVYEGQDHILLDRIVIVAQRLAETATLSKAKQDQSLTQQRLVYLMQQDLVSSDARNNYLPPSNLVRMTVRDYDLLQKVVRVLGLLYTRPESRLEFLKMKRECLSSRTYLERVHQLLLDAPLLNPSKKQRKISCRKGVITHPITPELTAVCKEIASPVVKNVRFAEPLTTSISLIPRAEKSAISAIHDISRNRMIPYDWLLLPRHRNIRVLSAPNAVPPIVMPAGASLQDGQMLLLEVYFSKHHLSTLFHALHCDLGTACSDAALCSHLQQLWDHLGSCGGGGTYAPACRLAQCGRTKKLLSHYRRCASPTDCLVCTPIGHKIRLEAEMATHDGIRVVKQNAVNELAQLVQQYRLFWLNHASTCRLGEACAPSCQESVRILDHVASCEDDCCATDHCMSSRVVLDHANNCLDFDCLICCPAWDSAADLIGDAESTEQEMDQDSDHLCCMQCAN